MPDSLNELLLQLEASLDYSRQLRAEVQARFGTMPTLTPSQIAAARAHLKSIHDEKEKPPSQD